MKKLYHLAYLTLLCVGCALSYWVGTYKYNKVFNDACHMSDLIRCYNDHLTAEDAIIEDYGCFEELQGNFLFDDCEDSPVNLKDYYWCY